MHKVHSESGVSLIETMVAMLVLTVGAVGMAGTFLQGMRMASSSPSELIAVQKASEAIESVYSARDSHTITWDQIKNKADGGVFLNTADVIKTGGNDGIVNTGGADEVVEEIRLPGVDEELDTADDKKLRLDGFQREIDIVEISPTLREITVTITYSAGGAAQKYVLTAYISSFA